MPRSLTVALGLSLLLHALPFAANSLVGGRPPPPPPSLQAYLAPSHLPLQPAAPELILPEPATSPAARPEKSEKTTVDRKKKAKTWSQSVREQFAEQQREGLFYPETAISQGIEGEVVVLLLLDPEGRVAAARIESGSGHAILDEAALRAVRRLRTLPADAPSEALLPVRFRLRQDI